MLWLVTVALAPRQCKRDFLADNEHFGAYSYREHKSPALERCDVDELYEIPAPWYYCKSYVPCPFLVITMTGYKAGSVGTGSMYIELWFFGKLVNVLKGFTWHTD